MEEVAVPDVSGSLNLQIRCLQPFDDGLESADEYIRSHPEATPYHRIAWLKAVNLGYRHRAVMLVATEGSEKPVGVLPVCLISKPFGSNELVSQPFCDLGGPLSDSEKAQEALIEAAKTLARQERAGSLWLRCKGGKLDDDAKNASQGAAQKVSMICELPENSETLFKSYKPKLRSQIRKAEKNGLTAVLKQSPEAIAPFYEVFAENMHRLGSPVHSKDWFSELQKHYGNDMLIGLVFLDDKVVGAGIVLINGYKASIPWASTRSEYNHLAPNMLLYWTFLSELADRGISFFDFGRSSLGEGTYRFKKQWGAVPYGLNWYDALKSSQKSSDEDRADVSVSRIRGMVESIWRHLPLSVANRLGPLIRRYISL